MKLNDLDKLSLNKLVEEKLALQSKMTTYSSISILSAIIMAGCIFGCIALQTGARIACAVGILVSIIVMAYFSKPLQEIKKKLKYYRVSIKIRAIEHMKIVQRNVTNENFDELSEDAQDELIDILDEYGE